MQNILFSFIFIIIKLPVFTPDDDGVKTQYSPSCHQHAKHAKIVIQNTKFDIFKYLLHFVYSGRFPTPINEFNAQPLFKATDEFDIQDGKT